MGTVRYCTKYTSQCKIVFKDEQDYTNMIGKREIISTTLALLIFVSFAVQVSAITASIGNSRMVLRVSPGEEIRKYILVKNVNDVSINVEMSPSGDLAEEVEIEEANFSLNAGEEKRAYFTIKTNEEGTTETKINIKFSEVSEGRGKSGVGLSSTIIMIASGTGSDESEDAEDSDNSIGEIFQQKEQDASVDKISSGKNSLQFSPVMILGISTAILALVLIFLVAYYAKTNVSKINSEKRPGRPSA